MQGRVHLSTLILAAIGCFDLVTTLMLLQRGIVEGNPLFAKLATQGSLVFALGKVIFLGGPIILLEIARKSRPQTAEVGTWVAIVAYLALYVPSLIKLREHF